MNQKHIDIGNLRNDPERLYDLCVLLTVISDSVVWDRESELYRTFRDLLDDLWQQVPNTVTITVLNPNED